MRAAFKGTCDYCGKKKPGCADVHERVGGKATMYHAGVKTACKECRKQMHGKYRLAAQHS